MKDVLFVDKQAILAATSLMPSVMDVMNFATLCRTAPTRFLLQEHHTMKTDLSQGINTLTTDGTGHIPIMVPDIGDISAGHKSCHNSHCTRSSSFKRHTSCSSSSHHNSLCCPLFDGCPSHQSFHDTKRHSCTPSHTYHLSCRHHSCHSTDQS